MSKKIIDITSLERFSNNIKNYIDNSVIENVSTKQDKLVSGTNIKTINGESILGDGDIEVSVGDLSGYATEEWVNNNYATEYDLNNNVNILNQSIASKQDKIDNIVIAEDVNEELDDVEINTYVKYVAQTLTEEQKSQVRSNIGVNLTDYAKTTDLTDYAKTEDLTEYAKTEDLTEYAKTTDLTKYAKTTDLTEYAKTTDLTKYAKTTDLTDYAKTTDLTKYAKTTDLTDYAKTTDLTKYAKTEDLTEYAKTTDLTDYAKTTDLSNVATSGSYNDLLDKPTQITKPILEAPYNDNVAGFTGDSVMRHGIIYISMVNNIDTITIENFEAPDKDVVEYVWHFKTCNIPTVFLPSYIYWANGEFPEIENYTIYELSITAVRDYSTDDYIYKAVLVPFKTI